MKKKMMYRRLNDAMPIYQLYKVVDANYENENIKLYDPEKEANEFYVEKNLDDDVVNKILYRPVILKDKDISFLVDPFEIKEIKTMFWEKYKDFELVPKESLDIGKLRAELKEDIYYQDEAVDKLLNILKSNIDILNSDIDDESKADLITGMLVYGPSGYGKTALIKSLLSKISIPHTTVELTRDPTENLNEMVNGLIKSANGNVDRATKGIVVIEDNFDELIEMESAEDFDPISLLQDFLGVREIYCNDEENTFDLSQITYILIKKTLDDELECLLEEGILPGLMDKMREIINVSLLDENQLFEIIKNHPNSHLNLYKKILASVGKELVVDDDFIKYLIDKLSTIEGGLHTINRCLESVIKKYWHMDKIELKMSDIDHSIDLDVNVFEINIDEEKSSTVVSKPKVTKKESNSQLPVSNKRDNYKKILDNLRQYIKGQDDPLMQILYRVFINDIIQNSDIEISKKKEEIKHILVRGGTGTGKTYISTKVAESFPDKTYIVADCKQYTEAGFVGKSVDDLLIQLYNASGQNIEKAQKGVLILDEFDKLASGGSSNAEVGRKGVQEALLKLLEGSIFELELDRFGSKRVNFDTRNLTVMCLGAFEGLDKIKESRLKEKKGVTTIGFSNKSKDTQNNANYINENFTLEDLQQYGMQSQVLRRLSFIVDLNKLDKQSFREIMLEGKSSAFLTKIRQLELLGVKVTYNEEFIDTFLERVIKMGYGASSIDILTNHIFRKVEIEAFLNDCEEIVLDKECVDDPSKVTLIPKKQVVKRKIKS